MQSTSSGTRINSSLGYCGLATRLKTKSIHSALNLIKDEMPIVVTRIRGLALPKKRYDVWMAILGAAKDPFGVPVGSTHYMVCIFMPVST